MQCNVYRNFLARMHYQLLFAICFCGLLGSQRVFAQEVTEVHIDLNSTPPAKQQADTTDALSLDAASESDELTKLKEENAKLKAELELRSARKDLATAIATVTLKYAGEGSLKLAPGDFLELFNVKFMKARRAGFLQWDEVSESQAAKSQTGTGTGAQIGTAQAGGGQANAPRPQDPGLSNNDDLGPPDALVSAATDTANPPIPAQVTGATKTDSQKSESQEPAVEKANAQKPEERKPDSRVASTEVDSPSALIQVKDGSLAIEMKMGTNTLAQDVVVENKDPKFNGSGLFTYQQPMRPWKIIYQEEGTTLRQWVHFANFTAYPWPAKMPITLSDRNALGVRQYLRFQLGHELPAGQSAIQCSKAYEITEKSYVANLVKGNAKAFKLLTLSNAEFLPPGEFREEFQPQTNARQAARVDAGQLLVGPDPRALVESKLWEKEVAYEPVELDAGVFVIRTTRKSTFNLKNFGDSGSVLLNKPASGWKLSTPGWVTNDDDIHQLTVDDFANSTVELFEYLETNLDINKPGDFDSFTIVAKSIRGKTIQSQMEQKLVSLVDKKLTIAENLEKHDKAEAEYNKLRSAYDSIQLGNDVINDNSRRITLRSLWERMNVLATKIESLKRDNEALSVQVEMESYSSSSIPL